MSDAYHVLPDEPGERLDQWLARKSGISRAQVQKRIAAGQVLCHTTVVDRSKHPVALGEEYRMIQVEEFPSLVPQAIPLDIYFEDEHLLVVNKPQGMLVHPTPGSTGVTLVHALLAHTNLSDGSEACRPGIVHRLDKDTSGLLVVAKTNAVHEQLTQALAAQEIKRFYLAMVDGVPMPLEGMIELPIGRSQRQKLKRIIDLSHGREARTRYETVLFADTTAVVRCQLETGRTHQIRVHLSAIGHPVIGDPMYGQSRNRFGFKGQALHAYRLRFAHPVTQAIIDVRAQAPSVFRSAITRLCSENAGRREIDAE